MISIYGLSSVKRDKFASQITKIDDFWTSTPACDVNHQQKALMISNFSCEGILFDNAMYESNLLQAEQFMLKNSRFLMGNCTEEYFIDLTQDCDKFKSKLGYRTAPLDDEDVNFPIAFNLLVHENVAQFERLLRAIYRPQNSYCIHIDTKSSKKFFLAMKKIVGCFNNVFIASKLESVVYAGYSRLQADINCMKDQLKSPIKWRYLLNTATNAYPLKTNAEIVKILKIYNGANDIRATIFGRQPIIKQRWAFEWIEKKMNSKYKVVKTGRSLPPPPHNLKIAKGSAYGIFSRNFIDYLINDKVAQDYLEWCRSTYSPDEHYWNTLHHTYFNPHINPPGSYSGKSEKSFTKTY